LCEPRFGKALIHFPDLESIIWSFPNDPKIPHLLHVIDVDKVKYFLPYDTLPAGLNNPNDISDVSVDVVRYHPEVRCTTRYELQYGTEQNPHADILYGKTFKAKHSSGAAICSRLNDIWTWSQQDPDAFRVPQPLGFNETVKTLWQTGLPGQPIGNVINRQNCKALADLIAKGLASLHKAKLQTSITTDIYDHLAQTKKYARYLIANFSEYATIIQSLVQELEKTAPALVSCENKPIHGSFRLTQLLADHNQLSLHQCSPINCARGTNLATRERIKHCKDVPVMIAF
jgi:hypothetical protein